MFGLRLATKIYIAVEAVDMRKDFEGLVWTGAGSVGADPRTKRAPVSMFHRTRTRMKALAWAASCGCAPSAWRRAVWHIGQRRRPAA